MKFKNGYFGACVVVLALLGTVLAGFVTDIEKTTVPVTNYDFVTDVSGLFTYEQTPEYVDYSPSSNYTGYTGEATYADASGVNQYRYVKSQGTPTTETLTFSDSSDYPGDYGSFTMTTPGGYVYPPQVYFQWNGVIDFGSTTSTSIVAGPYNARVQSVGTPVENSRIHFTRLSNILEDLGVTTAQSSEISINYTSTYPVLFYSGSWTATEYGVSGGTAFTYWAQFNEDNTMPTRLTVESSSMLVKAYRNDTLIWTQTADNVGVTAWYANKANGYTNPVNASVTFTAVNTPSPTYGYMDPNQGVYMHGPTPRIATWSNGYTNDEVTLKLVGSAWHVLYFGINTASNDFSIQWTDSGTIRVKKISDTEYTDLGNWPACQVTIKGISGLVEVTPTTDTSLTSTVQPNNFTFTFDDLFTPGTISTIRFYKPIGLNYTPHFQVVKTTVFLDTYNTVMNNPSLDVGVFFPNMADSYRLNFYSFAVLGSEIRINDTVLTVNKANATVTFSDVNDVTHTEKINNFYVTNDDGRTTLTFQNSGRTYDLGETDPEASAITFSGLWFFTTGLYQPVAGQQEVYNWNLDGAYHASAGQTLVIFLGIMGLSIILGVGYFKVSLRVLDWILLIGAAFFVLIYFGGLV